MEQYRQEIAQIRERSVTEGIDIFMSHQVATFDLIDRLVTEGYRIFRLSTTERQEFKECRRRWDFSSMSRQAIEPKRPATALWFGHGIHKGLEEHYSGNDGIKAFDTWAAEEIERISQASNGLWDDQVNELRDMVELGKGILEGYIQWSSVADLTAQRGFRMVHFTEREFIVPIMDSSHGVTTTDTSYNIATFTDANGQKWAMFLVGRLDLIVEDFYERLWVMDHKTSKDKLDIETLTLDDQMTVYLWAAQQIFGRRFEGAYYNVLRKKLPVVPKVLVSGKALSQDKSIDTTYEVYYNEIIKQGFNPDDYKGILTLLQEKPNTFYQREKVRRNQAEILNAGAWLYYEAIDMLNDPFLYTNPTWDCKWKCDFRELCKAMNRNDDVTFMRENMFQKREEDEASVYCRQKIKGSTPAHLVSGDQQ